MKLLELYYNDDDIYFNAWITPDNHLIKVHDHLSFMVQKFPEHYHKLYSDYDEGEFREFMYNNAFENGWVRVIRYPINDDRFEFVINSSNTHRIKETIKRVLKPFIKSDTSFFIDCGKWAKQFDMLKLDERMKFRSFIVEQKKLSLYLIAKEILKF